MSAQKFRWSKVYESSEEELVGLLKARSIKASRFAAEAESSAQPPATTGTTTIWCAEGSLRFASGHDLIPLQPGDALRLDKDTAYELQPGITGYVCYLTS